MTTALGARRAELSAVERCLTTAAEDGRCQIVEIVGEAGIGKSHLLRTVADRARARGVLVLRTGLTSAETTLSWAGLSVLVRQVDAELLESLPEMHRHLLGRASGAIVEGPVGADMVAFAFAELIHRLTSLRPVALLVDDLHWLDVATAGALASAVRANHDRRCAVVTARRIAVPVPVELDRIEDVELTRVQLSGLSLAGTHDVLEANGHTRLRRPDLVRIHELTRGNPLLAIELARARAEGAALSTVRCGDPLPTMGRLDRLDEHESAVALSTALMARPTFDDVIDVVGAGAEEAIVRLRRLDLLDADGATLRFTHPLRREAVIERAGPPELRRMHRRIAAVVTDAEQRVLHLSEAAERPEASLALEIERAGEMASDLGVHAIAATRFRRSAELTPACDDRDRWRRMHRAIVSSMAVGDHELVLDEARELYREATTSAEIAAAGFALCRVERLTLGIDAAIATVHDALSRMGPDAAHHEQLMEWLVRFDQFRDVARAARTARTSLESALRRGDDRVVRRARTVVASAQVLAGEPTDVEALLPPDDDVPIGAEHVPFMVETLVWTNRVERAIRILEPIVAHARAAHDIVSLLLWQSQLGDAYLRAGRWDDAHDCLAEVVDLHGPGGMSCGAQIDLAWLLAARGDDDGATELVERNRLAMPPPPDLDRIHHAARAGFVDLCAGRWTAAVEHLSAARHEADEVGMVDAAALPFGHDLVEARVMVGDHEGATREAERFAAAADRARAPLGIALAWRSRAIVANAAGQLDRAGQLVTEAVSAHDGVPQVVFEAARTRLLAGSILRRAGRRTAARVELESARSTFAMLGAAPFVSRVDAELARLTTRRAPEGLTGTERRVAELAGAGMTNAEIAASMSISVRTVESNLTRVYRKLGVRSRTELAARTAPV